MTQGTKNLLEENLSNVFTDLSMLQDGSWQPDGDSIQASLNNLHEIAHDLKINIVDTRK